jgi:hypothetical protein
MNLANERKKKLKELLDFCTAVMESMVFSARGDDVWRHSSYYEYARKNNELVECLKQVTDYDIPVGSYDLKKMKTPSNTIAMEQKYIFDSVYTNLSIIKAYLENELGIRNDEAASLKDFFQANLRKAVQQEPKNEKQVQDVVEALLIGRGLTKGIDYDREVGRVKVSIKEVVPDFILHKLNMAIEIKLSKDKNKSKAIVDEINADIQAYAKQYSRLLFIIYDMGSIRDETEFKQDLENSQNTNVIVVKH